MRKLGWVVFATMAVLIGLYPVIYFVIDRKFGLLSTKSVILLQSFFWNLGFYTHIILGGLALLIGWTQFSNKWRILYTKWHRNVGKLYVAAALVSAVAGFGIAFFATGGWSAAFGFICLACIWFVTTLRAFLFIRVGNINAHQKMMIWSYAACFAAVMLRIWLPILIVLFNDFNAAYRVVAWLCWVPNMLVALVIVKRLKEPLLIKKI